MRTHLAMGRASVFPLALIEQAIPKLSRHDLEGLTERLIDRLDELDGDIDLETNGDELDGSLGEDDFHRQNENWRAEPGCPLADPDTCGASDDGCSPVLVHDRVFWGAPDQ